MENIWSKFDEKFDNDSLDEEISKLAKRKPPKPKFKYDVYFCGGCYAGTSVDVSPQKAINNVRFQYYYGKASNADFYAVEAKE